MQPQSRVILEVLYSINKSSFTEKVKIFHIVLLVLKKKQVSALKLLELFLGASSLGHLQYIEADRFAEGTTLSHCHNISHLDISEGRGEMNRHVLVAFLEPVVLPNVM